MEHNQHCATTAFDDLFLTDLEELERKFIVSEEDMLKGLEKEAYEAIQDAKRKMLILNHYRKLKKA